MNDKAVSFKTVSKEASSELIVEKSRFIAHVTRADSEEEARAYIGRIKEQEGDATHNVPAFIIGHKQDKAWSSEDGEPQGTAGAPVLKMLLNEGYTNICVVITRYFGGIKLGPGGLIRAYTEVAKAALKEAGDHIAREKAVITMETGYSEYNRIKAIRFPEGTDIEVSGYGEKVTFILSTYPGEKDDVLSLIRDTVGTGFRITGGKMVIA